MVKISLLPIFTDNYIWLIQQGRHVIAVDPGDAAPLQHWLAANDCELAAILITHHHSDHVGGLADLAQQNVPVYGPAGIQYITDVLYGGETIKLLNQPFQVLATPGHTLDHLSYLGAGALFCGDTLFAGGCGRLLGGSAEQLFHSLTQLAALPPSTLVCCTHEYTLSNLRFAASVEPHNRALIERQTAAITTRSQHLPTLPSTIALELTTNPFLRTHLADVFAQVQMHNPDIKTPLDCFTALRSWKDSFR